MKKLTSQEIYNGRVIRVVNDRVLLDNGVETEREVVRHKGAAAVVAVDNDEDLLVVEQYRYPIERSMLELPAGIIDEGETPLACAQRELLEETGFTAKDWKLLLSFYPSAGVHDEIMHLYLATGLEHKDAQHLDHDEILTVRKVPFYEVYEQAQNGEIQDGKTIMGVLLAERFI
ncbi:MAG: NUDIX domain-containing protein [Bacillota bacterium]